MTAKRQVELIAAACREAGLDSHIKTIERASDAHTRAEQIANQFRGRRPLPVKNSYMYCDTLDVCFFYIGAESDKPCFSFSGYATATGADITEGRLLKAFEKAQEVLQIMKRLAETEV